MVFIIAAEIYAFGAAVYLILGSGKKQPWADGYNHDSSATSKSLSSSKSLQPKNTLLGKTNGTKVNLSTSVVNT